MIETRLLKQFIAVAEELNYHKAAQRLHMAQPPLSQAMTRLEDRLGFTLLIRSKRGVTLTAAGVDFLQTARHLTTGLESGIARARDVSRGVAGTLSIATISFAYYPRILAVLSTFREQHEKVKISVREMPSSNQISGLLSGDFDVAILRRVPCDDPTVTFALLEEDDIVLAMPASDPRAGASEINLYDFANDGFVFTPHALGSGYHNQLVRVCEDAGFYPRIVQEAQHVHTQIGLVGAGFGVALLPQSIANAIKVDSVRFCRFTTPEPAIYPGVDLHIAWRSSTENPLIETFLKVVHTVYADRPHKTLI